MIMYHVRAVLPAVPWRYPKGISGMRSAAVANKVTDFCHRLLSKQTETRLKSVGTVCELEMTILDLLQTGEDPKYPGLVLTLHVIAKNVELGSLLGLALGVLGGTADFLVKKQNPLIRMLKMCEFGVCLGTIVGLFSLARKAHFDETMDADGIRDRAYRLTHSVPGIKHKMDVRFLGGGVIGATLVGFLVPESWVKMDFADRLARGYCLGAAIGACDLTSKVARKMLNKQLEMK